MKKKTYIIRPSSAGTGTGDSFPVGTILPYQGSLSEIPEKWALCDGLTHNGVTTPNLLDGRFLEGSSNPKDWHPAGLPNITGYYGWAESGLISTATGAFEAVPRTAKYRPSYALSDTTDCKYRGASLNASRCSEIYRDDITTVQPKSYTVLYIMKIKK